METLDRKVSNCSQVSSNGQQQPVTSASSSSDYQQMTSSSSSSSGVCSNNLPAVSRRRINEKNSSSSNKTSSKDILNQDSGPFAGFYSNPALGVEDDDGDEVLVAGNGARHSRLLNPVAALNRRSQSHQQQQQEKKKPAKTDEQRGNQKNQQTPKKSSRESCYNPFSSSKESSQAKTASSSNGGCEVVAPSKTRSRGLGRRSATQVELSNRKKNSGEESGGDSKGWNGKKQSRWKSQEHIPEVGRKKKHPQIGLFIRS